VWSDHALRFATPVRSSILSLVEEPAVAVAPELLFLNLHVCLRIGEMYADKVRSN
jgi:hypothetical protein